MATLATATSADRTANAALTTAVADLTAQLAEAHTQLAKVTAQLIIVNKSKNSRRAKGRNWGAAQTDDAPRSSVGGPT